MSCNVTGTSDQIKEVSGFPKNQTIYTNVSSCFTSSWGFSP